MLGEVLQEDELVFDLVTELLARPNDAASTGGCSYNDIGLHFGGDDRGLGYPLPWCEIGLPVSEHFGIELTLPSCKIRTLLVSLNHRHECSVSRSTS